MRFPTQSRMSVTRRGEKAQRLSAFIVRSLASQGDAAGRPGGITVIARSLQSPVARAIGALAADIAAAGLSVRILLLKADGAAADAFAFPQAAAGLDCELRLARDPRLIEAHEQLVLGPGTCWTGDSMRRDPLAYDAYETFVDDCAQIAGAAASTFARLWIGGEPLLGRPIPSGLVVETDGPSRMPGREPSGLCGEM
jgi:hypothetical protein